MMPTPKTERVPEISGPLGSDSYFAQLVRILRNNFISLENYVDDNVNIFLSTTINTTPYTISVVKPVFICDSTSGDLVVNLVSAVKYKNKFMYFKKSVEANNVTLTPYGSETIDLDTSYVLMDGSFDAVKLYSDGANWWVI